MKPHPLLTPQQAREILLRVLATRQNLDPRTIAFLQNLTKAPVHRPVITAPTIINGLNLVEEA